MSDPHGATIGFEMIVPTLLAEASALGIIPNYGDDILGKAAAHQRAAKLAKMKGYKINRFTSMAFSAEMLGCDNQSMLDLERLQEANGSSGHSPSATAYFAMDVQPGDSAALNYLRTVIAPDGGVPNLVPFDVFEQTWILWNLALTSPLDNQTLAIAQPFFDFIEAAWKPGEGVSLAAGFTPRDGDDTSVAYEVLTRFGRSVDVEAVLQYEREDYFSCFTSFEAGPSPSVNIHMLGALRQAGFDPQHPSIQKILKFLQRTLVAGTFWLDKWHTSPYYTSAHAVITCAGYADDLVQNVIDWMLATQGANGAWGYYVPTAEETAYCLQALVMWRRQGKPVPTEAIKRGAAWLAEHTQPPYPALWIGKCLYSPELIVRSAILSALTLVAQE
jgi:halimadienyl-diphosphate synthase